MICCLCVDLCSIISIFIVRLIDFILDVECLIENVIDLEIFLNWSLLDKFVFVINIHLFGKNCCGILCPICVSKFVVQNTLRIRLSLKCLILRKHFSLQSWWSKWNKSYIQYSDTQRYQVENTWCWTLFNNRWKYQIT